MRKAAVPLLLVVAFLAPAAALGFKGGVMYRKVASAGGGGGVYFTGAPPYKRWDCSICHVGAERKIRLHLAVDPSSLLDTGSYVPGGSYKLTVSFDGEHRGFDSMSNTNGMAATLLDARNAPAGRFSQYTGFVPGNHDAEIATDGIDAKLTSWTVTWTAPAAGTGPVTLYVGAVDGDGASRPDLNRSDALHDDVAVGSISFREGP